ncbi:MAG: hypothetical protein WCJ35_08535 [Planctomycetota bacterium]
MKRLVPVLSLLLFAIVGCGQKPGQPIVGKWERIDKTGTGDWFNFLEDGSAIFIEHGEAVQGKWRFLDDGRLETEVPGRANQEPVKFEGDTMSLTGCYQEVRKYRKVASHP